MADNITYETLSTDLNVNGSNSVAGYSEVRNQIINTLMGRPAGHEITPQEHQEFELLFLNYTRSVELISASTLIGFAEADTVPVQPDNANVAYVSTISNNSTVIFSNFHGQDGSSIQVTTDGDHAGVIILLRRYDLGYWEYNLCPITLSDIGDISYVIKYVHGFTTNITVGGIAAGTKIPDNTSVLDIVRDMLYTYICPSLSISGSLSYEKGETKNVTITYKATDSSSAQVTKLELYKGGTLLETRDPATSGTSYSYNDTNITTDTTYQVRLYDSTKRYIADSNHTKSSGVYFFYKYFMGYVAKTGTSEEPNITTSAQVRGLTTKTGFINAGSVTIVGDTNTTSQAYFLVVCVPEEYKVSCKNVLGGDYVVNSLSSTIAVNLGGGTSTQNKNYKVYYIGGTPSYKQLKINS